MGKSLEGITMGVASASFQIEGGWNADGKGESIWDRWLHTPGHGKATGDVAADHYHLYEEDLKLLKELGVDSYRFSVSWPRVLPEGHGKVNEAGLQFYRNILSRLKEYGIKSAVTIFHWDFPQKLQDIGGWTNPLTPTYFNEYAELLFREFGQDVDTWITFNEPYVSAFIGHAEGRFAPGHRDMSEALAVTHNILLSHGLAVKAYREGGYPGKIGITLDNWPAEPFTDRPEDQLAAQRHREASLGIFADPIFKGHYPQHLWEHLSAKGLVMPEVTPEDMALIHSPIDFLGINYYGYALIQQSPGSAWPFDYEYKPQPSQKDNQNYRLQPERLGSYLKYLNETYAPKEIMVTENGYSAQETADRNGQVPDYNRIDFLYRHIEQCVLAKEAGVPLTAYYVWCFLDDLEWTGGYSTRMGLVRVDYETQKRTIKASGHWYRRIIQNRRLED